MKKKIYLLELVEFYYYDTKDDENVEDRWIIGYFLTLSKLVEAISKCFDLKKETERIVVTSFDIKLNYNQKFVYVLSYEYSYLLNNNYIDYSYVFGKFQRCPFNVGKPFFRWGYVILSQNKSDLVVF